MTDAITEQSPAEATVRRFIDGINRHDSRDLGRMMTPNHSMQVLDGLPLVVAVPSAPALPPGSRIRLSLAESDLLELSVQTRFESILSADAADHPLRSATNLWLGPPLPTQLPNSV